MRYELFIGLRYLRAKRREAFISLITLISTVGVAIGVMTLNIVLAVMTGFEEDLRDRILGFNPHVMIMNRFGPIANYEALLERARATPGVTQAGPFVYGHLMLSTPKHVAGVLARGVHPTGEAALDLAEHMREGGVEKLGRRHPVPLSGGLGSTVELPGIILGAELARELGVGVGDPVSVALPMAGFSGGGVPRLTRFVVVGRFESGMPEYDSAVAYVSLRDAQALYLLGDAVSSVELKLDDIYRATEVARHLAAQLGGQYQVQDWMEANESLFSALKLQKTVYFIVLLLIVLVAAFTILATLIMVVMEKRGDIAILKSMGAPPASIRRIFVFKGLVIGLIGTLIGNIAGYAGCWALERYHFVELPKDVFYVSTVPVTVYPEYFLFVTVAALLICLLATLYPARQAARLVPVDIIRYG